MLQVSTENITMLQAQLLPGLWNQPQVQHPKHLEQEMPCTGRLFLSWHRLVAESPTIPPSIQHQREGWESSAPAAPDLEREQTGPQTDGQTSKTKQNKKPKPFCAAPPALLQIPQPGSGCLLCPGCVHNPWVKLLNHWKPGPRRGANFDGKPVQVFKGFSASIYFLWAQKWWSLSSPRVRMFQKYSWGLDTLFQSPALTMPCKHICCMWDKQVFLPLHTWKSSSNISISEELWDRQRCQLPCCSVPCSLFPGWGGGMDPIQTSPWASWGSHSQRDPHGPWYRAFLLVSTGEQRHSPGHLWGCCSATGPLGALHSFIIINL